MHRPTRLARAASAFAVATSVLVATPAAASAATQSNLRSQQWGLDAIDADAAHTVATGAGVVVAVIDTGLDLEHPQFAGKIVDGASWICPAGVAVPCFGSNIDDRNGHGTHVAGTIVAPDDGIGTTGVAPDALIMPLRVLDADGSGSMDAAAEAIDWAIAHGASVINLSLGASYGLGAVISNPVVPLDGGFTAAINRAADAGVLVAVAAGNDSLPYCGGGELYADDAVCVASHGPDGLPSYFSDWGAAIDVVAPGGAGIGCATDVLATWPLDIATYCGLDGYDAIAGTSMASPHVAGVGALLAELGVHGREARQVIIDTAGGLPVTAPGGVTGPYLDAQAAVAAGASSVSTAAPSATSSSWLPGLVTFG